MTRSGKSIRTLLALCPVLAGRDGPGRIQPVRGDVPRRSQAHGGRPDFGRLREAQGQFCPRSDVGHTAQSRRLLQKQGKTATAWARFHNAASLAKSQGKAEQAAEANRRIKVLEPDLSYLTITVPEPVPRLEIKRDDLDVSPATYGVQVPVDPGPCRWSRPAGIQDGQTQREISPKKDKRTVTVPKLEKSAAAEAPEPGEVAAEPSETKESATKRRREKKRQRANGSPLPSRRQSSSQKSSAKVPAKRLGSSAVWVWSGRRR